MGLLPLFGALHKNSQPILFSTTSNFAADLHVLTDRTALYHLLINLNCLLQFVPFKFQLQCKDDV